MSTKFRKAQYYVWYLGWKECNGVYGRALTEPLVKELIHSRPTDDLPKLTIEVTKKELKIVQLQEKRKGKIDKIKYPPVLTKDVTYAVQAMPPDEDVVACIYLGYNPQTHCAVHVHVYRCDSKDTASMLVGHLNQLITLPENQERVHKIEQELARKGQISLRPDTYVPQASPMPALTEDLVSDDGRSDFSDPIRSPYEYEGGPPPHSPHQQHYPFNGDDENSEILDTLAEELKRKLKGRNAPLLLPPKDYDTVHRIRGNAFEIDKRMSHNPAIVGNIAAGDSYEGAIEEEKDIVFPISPRGSHGMQSSGSMESPVSPRGSRGKHSSGSGGSPVNSPRGGSRGSPGSPRVSGNLLSSSGGSSVFREENEADLQPVSPQWKTSHQVFHPPAGQPRRHNSDRMYDRPPARPFSPGPYTKDLKKKSYFPSSGLPNYMQSTPNGSSQYPYWGGDPAERKQEKLYQIYWDDKPAKGKKDKELADKPSWADLPSSGGSKKYTASSLGLTDGKSGGYATTDPRKDRAAAQRAPPPRNDRYTSIDRRDMPVQYNPAARGQPPQQQKGLRRSYMDDPRGGGYSGNHMMTGHQPTRAASFNY